MKIKIKFSFVILIVVFIAICFGNNSLAAEVESVNANYKNGKVTVSGKANCSRVAIRIIDEEGTVKGLSNASVLDKTFSKTINTGNLEEGKKYIVKVNNIVGGEESATTSFIVQPPEVKVTGIFLNVLNKKIKKGESFTLTATIEPSNATNKGVKWNSSNTDVATVNNGTVIAKQKGKATITVTSADGKKTASCEIEVIEENNNTNTSNGNNSVNKPTNDTNTSNDNTNNSSKNNMSSNKNSKNNSNVNNIKNNVSNLEENIERETNSILQNQEQNNNVENELAENQINNNTQEVSANIVETSKPNYTWIVVIIVMGIIIIIFLFAYLKLRRSKH